MISWLRLQILASDSQCTSLASIISSLRASVFISVPWGRKQLCEGRCEVKCDEQKAPSTVPGSAAFIPDPICLSLSLSQSLSLCLPLSLLHIAPSAIGIQLLTASAELQTLLILNSVFRPQGDFFISLELFPQKKSDCLAHGTKSYGCALLTSDIDTTWKNGEDWWLRHFGSRKSEFMCQIIVRWHGCLHKEVLFSRSCKCPFPCGLQIPVPGTRDMMWD